MALDGFRVIPVSGRGQCLYNAVSLATGGPEVVATAATATCPGARARGFCTGSCLHPLRQRVYDWVQGHWFHNPDMRPFMGSAGSLLDAPVRLHHLVEATLPSQPGKQRRSPLQRYRGHVLRCRTFGTELEVMVLSLVVQQQIYVFSSPPTQSKAFLHSAVPYGDLTQPLGTICLLHRHAHYEYFEFSTTSLDQVIRVASAEFARDRQIQQQQFVDFAAGESARRQASEDAAGEEATADPNAGSTDHRSPGRVVDKDRARAAPALDGTPERTQGDVVRQRLDLPGPPALAPAPAPAPAVSRVLLADFFRPPSESIDKRLSLAVSPPSLAPAPDSDPDPAPAPADSTLVSVAVQEGWRWLVRDSAARAGRSMANVRSCYLTPSAMTVQVQLLGLHLMHRAVGLASAGFVNVAAATQVHVELCQAV